LLRFDFVFENIDIKYLRSMYTYLPIHILSTIIIFYFCKMYHSLWKFVSINELGYILLANVISFFVQVAGMHLIMYPVPRSFFFVEILIQTVLVTCVRFSYRFVRYLKGTKNQKFCRSDSQKR